MNKTNRIQTHRHREPTDSCHGGCLGLGEKVKGLNGPVWWLQKSHRDVDYGRGNIVKNTVVIVCGARRVFEAARGPTTL